MNNLYANVAEVDLIEVDIDIYENLYVDSATIEFFWKYFRLTNADSIQKFGPPVNNRGVPLRIDHVDIASYEQIYDVLKAWFIKYIQMDTSKVNILKIETPLGGLYIRNVMPTEGLVHKFVTADLPASGEQIAMATFEQ